jgi:hypothetical protein
MGIKDVFSQAPSPEEEALYKQVLDEVESGVMRKGIYAKALADGLGDEGKAQSLYIKYRVQSLIDEEKHKAKLLGLKLAEEEKEKKAKEKERLKREGDARAKELDWSNLKLKGKTFTVIYYIIAFSLVIWLMYLIGFLP